MTPTVIHRSPLGEMILWLLLLTLAVPLAQAQTTDGPVGLTLDEALQIALANNYALQIEELNLANAKAQVREGWGELLPNLDLSSNYTRTIESISPFAGSSGGNFFSSFAFIDWLAFNEQARTDSDANTNPITFQDFASRQAAGLDAAGFVPTDSDNPFEVPNRFSNTLTITQKLFDGRVIWGARGASKYLPPFNQAAVDRQEHLLIDQVRQAYFGALLADEQARVVALSVDRTRATVQEVGKRVAQGLAPKFDRLSAEVQLANLETQLVQVENQAALALDNLKLLLGLPVNQEIVLRGELDTEDPGAFMQIGLEGAQDLALRQRPDLEQARLNVELQKVQLQATRTDYMPRLNAFANISYTGNVPSNRTNFFAPDPADPFTYTSTTNGFFSDAYWGWDVNAGFSLTWNLFNGFRTTQQVQQRKIALTQARIQQEQAEQAIRIEVERSLRNLEDAQRRIASQRRNVENAELNYQYARTRLREGVATPLQERDASDLLDQSRINYLQAVYDFLVARSAFETAVGVPMLDDPTLINLTGVE